MIRKRLFICLWLGVAVTAVRSHHVNTLAGLVFGSALQAFAVPGWLLVCAVRLFVPLSLRSDGPVLLMLVLTLLFWFFPVARVFRSLGRFDGFKDSGRSRPRILGAAVYLFEQANKRLFGRQKTGGWA